MKQCYNTLVSGSFVDLAATLADEFRHSGPAEHDRDGTFPFENYERMKETGYLGLFGFRLSWAVWGPRFLRCAWRKSDWPKAAPRLPWP